MNLRRHVKISILNAENAEEIRDYHRKESDKLKEQMVGEFGALDEGELEEVKNSLKMNDPNGEEKEDIIAVISENRATKEQHESDIPGLELKLSVRKAANEKILAGSFFSGEKIWALTLKKYQERPLPSC